MEEPHILYELLIHSEWTQEPEILNRTSNERTEGKPAGGLWQKLQPLALSTCPHPVLHDLIDQQLQWHFAVGGEGTVVAILQEQSLEIRSSRDEYGSVLGKTAVTKDYFPQWRKLMWSPDCSMLAVCQSTGSVEVYDLIGAHLFSITNTKAQGKLPDMGEAIAGILFCELRVKNTQWSYELIIANYKGLISSYFVSSTDGFEESHQFLLNSHYTNGISAMSYHAPSEVLIVCGRAPNIIVSESHNSLKMGITAWRILHGKPYYRLSLSLEEEVAIQKSSWWSKASPFFWKDRKANGEDIVYKMCVSPHENILAAVHVSGAVSLWDLPSLRLRKFWDLIVQPNYSLLNPQYCEPGMKRKAALISSNEMPYHLSDVNWWSNEAVILGRYNGALTVSSINSLENLLGLSPEWFEPSPQISAACDRGFLAMECESVVTTKKRSASEAYDEADAGDSTDDDDDVSFFTKAAQVAKTAMFYATDNERFRPPRKKMKYLNKTYRLLCLKSTTPEELFSRKINNEEYGEALALAKTYDLDCDLVYQRQWRKTPASVATIQDYLSKITKRSWVLHECLERVPETIDAAKELLLYGLQGTDLHALIATGKGEDHGRFIASPPIEIENGVDDYFPDLEEAKRKKEEIEKQRIRLLKQVNFNKLTLEQKQICECRLKLLTYLDRLTTYEATLGGPGMADDFFDHNFFKKFRLQSGLEACINFARSSNWQAIAAMFTYHGKQTLPHRLPILSNFPETTSPNEYQLLLPKVDFTKEGSVVCPWNEDQWRIADWCEAKYGSSTTSTSDDYAMDFYEEHKDFLKYRDAFAPEMLQEWFAYRTHEIESKSCIVDNALELVKLGIERNIQGLDKLLNDLATLDVLIYECQLERDISLKKLEKMNDFEIIQMLMSKSTEDLFIRHINQWLLPYLDRCEKRRSGSKRTLLRNYLINISKDNLKFCRTLFEGLNRDQQDAVLSEIEDQIAIAIDCIYVCERTDSLKDVCVILQHMPRQNHRITSSKSRKLQEQLGELEKHLRVAELLENHGNCVTLGFIRTCSQDSTEVKKLLTKLTRLAGRSSPVLSEKEWRHLLSDVLEIQRMFSNKISAQDCYEIFLQSLLCSGYQETIALAGKMMECTRNQMKRKSTSDQTVVSYKLPYDSSVSLVLKASQEHFNSSSSPSDECMSLAWSCLKLIEDLPSSIEEECDLISSLKVLQDFNVNKLPLQVRLCPDRLELLKQTLSSKPRAYRNSQKLLKLAYLLRVCGSNKKEREGKVLSLVAEAAFAETDYDSCFVSCTQLIAGEHAIGWEVCHNLGRCKEFSDIEARCNLLSFALVHCLPDLLEDILKAKAELQLQIICDRVKFLMGDDYQLSSAEMDSSELVNDDSKNGSTAPGNGMNSLWHTGEKTLHVLQSTTKTTKAVLTSVRSARFWKDAVSWMKPHNLSWEENSGEDLNKDMKLQGVCAFYSGVIQNAHISNYEANYQRFARPDLIQSVEIASKLFRATLLEDFIKTEFIKTSLDIAVITDLAKAYLPEDTMLSLFLLLAIDQLKDVDEMLRKMPSSPILLQFGSLYFALRIYPYINKRTVDSHEEHHIAPSEIIKEIEDFIGSKEFMKLSGDSELREAAKLLQKYQKMLYDLRQADILHSIGGGVDAARFAGDDVYKKETILGIAMTLDDEVFRTAASLAKHYKLPLWDVYMAQLEYLFSDSKISASTIESRIEDLKLLDVLSKKPKILKEKLEFCIYPNLDGKDHARLFQYFCLLELCSDAPDASGIKPSVHKDLLNKFKSIAKNLDYKLLMKPSSSTLDYLSRFLNESTVHVFAKAASKIPDQNGHFLDKSKVYCAWVSKCFFEGNSSSQKIPRTVTDWMHRYESCNDMIQKLTSSDVLQFIDNIVFSERALEVLSIECRTELIKRAIKFCKQKSSKEKEEEASLKWSTVVESLLKYQQHLQRIESPMLSELKESSDQKVICYIKELDLSRSIPEKLEQLVMKVVMEGPDLPVLQTLFSCCPAEFEWQPSDAYLGAVNLVMEKIRSCGNSSQSFRECESTLTVLENILKDISDNREDLLIDDMAFDVLYTFCQDCDIPVALRLRVLQLLEKTDYLPDEYKHLLLLYQTQAVVASIWPDYQVTEDDIQEELQRSSLFNKLIASSTNIEHFCSLAELLCHWPPFSASESDNLEWTSVLCGLAKLSEKTSLDKIIYFYEKAHSRSSLSQQSCWAIFQEILNQDSILHILKFAFKTVHEELHNTAVNRLKQHKELTSEDFDEELFNLILSKHLTVQIVSTSLYKPVIEHLLKQQEEYEDDMQFSMDSVIKEMAEAGYDAEAGSLLLIQNRTHPMLSTFSSAFSVLSKWISKPK